MMDRLGGKLSKEMMRSTGKSLDRVTEGASEAIAHGKAALQSSSDGAGTRLLELLRMDDDRPITAEALVVLLFDAVRKDGEVGTLSDKDVLRAAKRRYRRLGTLSLPAGPIGGYLVNLYCEAATLCDIVELRGTPVTDEAVAAHALVLWRAMPDSASAMAAIDGSGPTVIDRARDRVAQLAPRQLTKRTVITTLWNLRGVVGDARELSTQGLRQTLLPGARVKRFVEEAHAQLESGPFHQVPTTLGDRETRSR
jgi:hypothetical protein